MTYKAIDDYWLVTFSITYSSAEHREILNTPTWTFQSFDGHALMDEGNILPDSYLWLSRRIYTRRYKSMMYTYRKPATTINKSKIYLGKTPSLCRYQFSRFRRNVAAASIIYLIYISVCTYIYMSCYTRVILTQRSNSVQP